MKFEVLIRFYDDVDTHRYLCDSFMFHTEFFYLVNTNHEIFQSFKLSQVYELVIRSSL